MPARRIKPELDEKDLKIVESIILYPQASIEFIAQRTEIAQSTVQKRMSDMFAAERLARAIEVRDWKAAGYPLRYRIDIKVNQIAFREAQGGGPVQYEEPATGVGLEDEDGSPIPLPKPAHSITTQRRLGRYIKTQLARVKHFQGRLVCLDSTILLGQEYDMSLTVRAKDVEIVTDFVTRGLRFLRGVQSTMSSLESWSCMDEDR